jgi:hypothetical protein
MAWTPDKRLKNQVKDLLGFQVRLMGTHPWLDAEYSTELSQNEAIIIKYKVSSFNGKNKDQIQPRMYFSTTSK